MQVILETILLRREKNTKDRDGNPIVQLPPKTTKIEYLDLTPDEFRLYDAIFKNVKKDYESLNDRGLVTKNITSMLARIMTYGLSITTLDSYTDAYLWPDCGELHAISGSYATPNWRTKLRPKTTTTTKTVALSSKVMRTTILC